MSIDKKGGGGDRGGRYFDGRLITPGSVDGQIEPTEVVKGMYFAQTNSMQDIKNVLNNLSEDALKNSRGGKVDKRECVGAIDYIDKFLEMEGKVPGELLRSITGEHGLREAVIREIIKLKEKPFEGVHNLDSIIKNLENVVDQNSILEVFKNGLIDLKGSDGSSVNVQRYIDDLKYIKDWIQYNPGMPVENNFYLRFTGNYGLREAIMKATGR